MKTTSQTALILTAIVTTALAAGCGKKSGDKNDPASSEGGTIAPGTSSPAVGTIALSLTAQGTNEILEGSALRLTGSEDETYGYPGIGMNYGDVVVDGFKVKLLNIALQTVNEGGGYGNSVTLVDFGAEGKELQIADGFNGKIEVTKDVELAPGTYAQVAVQTENAFSLKAYAYLDRDNDGAIDATVWTTATEVKMETAKIAPGSMAGYDYYRYPWLVATIAKSLTDNSADPATMTTFLPSPVVVKDEGVASIDANGAESTAKAMSLSLLVDTFRIIKVWDGRYQAGNINGWTAGSGNAGDIPSPIFPFPQGENDSRTLNGSLKTFDLYPEGKPAFALGNYLSMFAFVNANGLKAQNYVISKSQTITPYNTQVMTLVLDGEGAPLFGKMTLGESNETLHIGPVARVFKEQSDGSYTYATAYGAKDATGKFDGGLWYSDDVARAGHLFTGFRKLTVGQRAEMSMSNGPRCKDEYDYCVDAAGVKAYYLRAQ